MKIDSLENPMPCYVGGPTDFILNRTGVGVFQVLQARQSGHGIETDFELRFAWDDADRCLRFVHDEVKRGLPAISN